MPNGELQTESQQKRAKSGCVLAFVKAVALLVLVASALYYSYKASQTEFARKQQERRLHAVADVKSGRGQVSISDAELLEMLADDPQCVANVTSVYFFIADLGDPRFHRLKELHNIKHIDFYDCRNADNVMVVAKDMESVQSLFFEGTRISDQSIQSLAEFPNLSKVRFEQVVADEVIDELNKLLPNVNVETPYPASKER